MNTCGPWLLETGMAISMMTGASMVVVVLNLVLQWVPGRQGAVVGARCSWPWRSSNGPCPTRR